LQDDLSKTIACGSQRHSAVIPWARVFVELLGLTVLAGFGECFGVSAKEAKEHRFVESLRTVLGGDNDGCEWQVQ
jgi:hypothetical protein